MSPPSNQVASRGNVDNYKLVTDRLDHMLSIHKLHIVALGEVNDADLVHLTNHYKGTQYKVRSLVKKVGRLIFNLGIVYNSKHLSVRKKSTLHTEKRGQKIRVSQPLILKELRDGQEFEVHVCHWASRTRESNAFRRVYAAEVLKQKTAKSRKKGSYTIIMGDLNDNPYDQSLFSLEASRCLEVVKKNHTELFYNPFWKALSNSSSYNSNKTGDNFPVGTLYYQEPMTEHWHAYDQMLFSGNFIKNQKWHLNESQSKVLNDDMFLSLIIDSSNKFDHLPIISEIYTES
nr:endonuclease/exonuclease/phosphatase family protein [Vibrio splendidus]